MGMSAFCHLTLQNVLPTAPKYPQVHSEPVNFIREKRPRSNNSELLQKYEAEHSILIAVNKDALNHKQTASHKKKIENVVAKIIALKNKAALHEE